jgi:hypothetical protein
MDERDRELLAGSLRELLATPEVDVMSALDELGWEEVLADDPAGATTLLFTEHGRALASSNVLDGVVLAALGRDVLADEPPVRRAVLYPPIGSSVVGTEGILITDPAGVDEVVVPVLDGLAVVSAAGLSVREAAGFDPGGRWRLARLSDGEPDPSIDPRRWEAAVAAGRRALAAELNGITETILGIAVDHTSGRVQYGRPIASYQSVRHRLAEGHASLAASRTLLEGAWSDGSVWAATAAKAQAGHAYLEVSRHAMQLCGAIGLTYEHRLHLFVQRGAVLDGLLGSARELTHDMGARLLDGYRPPTVVDL